MRMSLDPWSNPKDSDGVWDGLKAPDFVALEGSDSWRLPLESRGDTRLLWEPARLQREAGRLLSAGNSEQAGHASRSVLDWLRSNPFPEGPHYRCAMECAMRIPVFFYVLRLAPGLEKQESKILAQAMYRHASLVESRLSLHSSRGNHTAAEAVGLLFAGAVFAKGRRGRRWLERALELLREEADHLVLPDGGPGEQSFGYHRFVIDLFRLASSFLRENGLRSIHALDSAIGRGEAFLSAFEPARGSVLPIGDWDNGHATAPGIRPEYPAGSGEPRPSLESGLWKCRIFAQSGYTALKRRDGALLIFDHGDLGLPPLFNHGHADALSVSLYLGGVPLLADPGTYRYNGVPDWREYFRGTRAHNTVCVDGMDQAVQETAFVWSHAFQARLTKARAGPEGIVLEGLHEGYRRLVRPITHKRRIHARPEGSVEITDWFEGDGQHLYEQNFHLHPDIHLSAAAQGWKLVSKEGASLRLSARDGPDFRAARGELNPKMGWFSRCYGEFEPTSQLSRVVTGKPQEVRFAVNLEF